MPFFIIKTLIYWIAIPFGMIAIFNISSKAPSHLIWGIGPMIFGMFWSSLATAYLILDGHGTPFFGKYSPKRMVTCGPYSMSRHPIYFGYMIYTLGLVMLFNLTLIWIWIPSVFFMFILSLLEEHKLLKKFPNYAIYRKSKPHFIPLKKWSVNPTMQPPFLFAFLYMIGKILILFMYDIKSVGKEKIPDPPYLIVANHSSYFDPFYLMDTNNSYMRSPVTWSHYNDMKWLLNNVGMFPVKRYTIDTSAIIKIIRTLKSGGIIGLFVENERNWDGRPLKIKNSIIHFLESVKVPILPVRIEGAHLAWPRWAKHFHVGRIKVVIGKAINPEEYQRALDFVLKDTVPQSSHYKDYRGIESYLWQCPDCGTIGSIKSFKRGFECSHCHRIWFSPSVGEVREIHNKIYPKSTEELPISDEAIVNEKKSKISLFADRFRVAEENLQISAVKAALVESRHEFYIYTKKLLKIVPSKTSPLMWKEWIDFLKRDDPDYWSYK